MKELITKDVNIFVFTLFVISSFFVDFIIKFLLEFLYLIDILYMVWRGILSPKGFFVKIFWW